ncbi:nuclear transport factor 2 family protein [Dactylosporangium salmoneum]|uniref:SnoaL-like domain-containing protein n=1 Tax=Dactylosporangium salmoneum TaxID=53361 RepID=A0ABP5TQU8_9ACTN
MLTQAQLLDRAEIEDAVKRYCRAVDRCDWPLLARFYHADAAIRHGPYEGGPEGFVEFVKARRVGMRHTAHYVGNILVEFGGPDTAVAETYGFATQTFVPPSPLVPEGAVATRIRAAYRYVDRFERRDGRWAVAAALLVTGERDLRHFTDAPPDDSAVVGQQPSTADPLYAMLAQLTSNGNCS